MASKIENKILIRNGIFKFCAILKSIRGDINIYINSFIASKITQCIIIIVGLIVLHERERYDIYVNAHFLLISSLKFAADFPIKIYFDSFVQGYGYVMPAPHRLLISMRRKTRNSHPRNFQFLFVI